MPLRLALSGLLLLAALGLGLVGYQAMRPPVKARVSTVTPLPPPPTIDVLVATHSLPVGTLMKNEDFAQRAMPSAKLPHGALTNSPENRASLQGALVRHYIDAGNILVTGDVLRPRDRGFLAAVLAPSTRAISVGVDQITGAGGLIWPGDRVDVILTQDLNDKGTPLARRVVGETVLSDVRVVAVDQSIAQGAVASRDNAAGRLAHTVTLEVTPVQAERAAVAEQLGRLSLAIHAAHGAAEAANTRGPVYAGDVSPALAGGETPAAPSMRVIEGNSIREVMFR